MQLDKSYVCTKKFVEHQTPEKRERLLSYLSEAGKECYDMLPTSQSKPLKDLSQRDLLGKIHPSHFIEAFANLSNDIKQIYLSVLPVHVSREVATSLGTKEIAFQLEEKLATHYCGEIFSLLTQDKSSMLPLSCLSDDPLLCLTSSDSIELGTLTSFLGLFDLFHEIKSLINGKLILKLEDALSDDELKLLREIGNSKNKTIYFEPMGLSHWSGDISILRSVIKERGINRLAKAMICSSSDLIFLVEHIMDTKMKIEFRKYRAKMGDRSLVDTLIKQVNFCWDKICTISH